jgi:hypothetical protein
MAGTNHGTFFVSNLIADLFIIIRNARAWLVAFVLFGALLWILWETKDKRIEYQELRGELVEITAAGNKDDPMFYNGKVRLQDGTVVNITMSIRPPVPKVGNQVPVIFERYEGGKIMYGFNNAQWMSGGGISE